MTSPNKLNQASIMEAGFANLMALLRPHRFFKQSSGRIFLATSAVAGNAKVGTKKSAWKKFS
jgi:hypothetical protein